MPTPENLLCLIQSDRLHNHGNNQKKKKHVGSRYSFLLIIATNCISIQVSFLVNTIQITKLPSKVNEKHCFIFVGYSKSVIRKQKITTRNKEQHNYTAYENNRNYIFLNEEQKKFIKTFTEINLSLDPFDWNDTVIAKS